MMGKLNQCIFWLQMMTYEKNIKLFGIKPSLIWKKFDSEPFHNKTFFETKIKPGGDEVTDFYNKEIPQLTLTILVQQLSL